MSMKTLVFQIPAGEATPGPPLGTVLGPLGVPTPQIVAKMNEITKEFKGMKMPVILKVDMVTKKFEVEVGSPPTAGLIKKVIGLDKGTADGSTVADITMDQVKEVVKQKIKFMNAPDEKAAIKEVLGTCKSIGLTVDGKSVVDVLSEL
ncbi:MAG: 50S ribosomal protein L11 [Candidatus Altiarchaeota archaeon]|nr:50S ribosomal protein L11 [Candidatus Altiarchaeota archaeon]